MTLSNPEKRIIEELIRGTEIKDIPRKVLIRLRLVEKIIHELKEKTGSKSNFQLGYFIGQKDLLTKKAENRTHQRA